MASMFLSTFLVFFLVSRGFEYIYDFLGIVQLLLFNLKFFSLFLFTH